MTEKKAVFFDVDGTLFLQGNPVPESTVAAIHKLRENGHLAFVCSGRSRIMIPKKEILSVGFDGVIAACGMYASFGERILFDEEMTTEQLTDILPVLKDTDTMYILEGTEYIYYDERTIRYAIDDWYVRSIREMVSERFCVVPERVEDIHANKISIQVPKSRMGEVTEQESGIIRFFFMRKILQRLFRMVSAKPEESDAFVRCLVFHKRIRLRSETVSMMSIC